MFDIQSMMIKEHESSAVGHAITALAMRLARRPAEGDVPAKLRLCFLLPDEQGQLAFEGMRLSAHDPIRGILTIEACVPAHIVQNVAKAGPYVLAVTADALDAARDFFVEQGITGFDVDTLQAWVSTVKPQDLRPPNQQQVRNTDFEWS